jgi:tRNA (guanine37-N1)-methyltransferase
MRFHIITLFPNSFDSYLNESIISRAIQNKHISVSFYNPRDFIKPVGAQRFKEKPYLQVDDRPYGGGPGMVLKAEPILKAYDKIVSKIQKIKGKVEKDGSVVVSKYTKHLTVFLAPAGKQFTNEEGQDFLKKYSDIIILCGRYEGIDARVKKLTKAIEYSVGPFVTTGGELPAMLIVDVVSRRIPGVLGKLSSLEEMRVAGAEIYTRPETITYKGKNYKVPKVLMSGNHKKIEEKRDERKGGVQSSL